MADKDTPTVHSTVAELKSNTKEVEPFTFGVSGSKRITFPDFYAMESEEGERVTAKLNQRNAEVWSKLNAWLSKEDAELLRQEKLTFIELIRLVSQASQHYENHYGSVGESGA